jgi:hypothetical protein
VIPDAIAPILAAVMQEHPAAGPARLARLAVAELRSLGWHITVPRPTTGRRPECPPAAAAPAATS